MADREQEVQTPKIWKFENPRYVGDIRIAELATPQRAKEASFVLKDTVKRQRNKIRIIQERNRRLLKKLRSFADLVEHLKSKNLTTEEAGNTLFAYLNKLLSNKSSETLNNIR